MYIQGVQLETPGILILWHLQSTNDKRSDTLGYTHVDGMIQTFI